MLIAVKAFNPFPMNDTGRLCREGHYCPEGTAMGAERECTRGTFSNVPGRFAPEHCSDCPPGMFCDKFGATAPSGPCEQGRYCSGRATISRPEDAEFGSVCQENTFCGVGSGAFGTGGCPFMPSNALLMPSDVL